MLCGDAVAVLFVALFFRGIRLTFRAGMSASWIRTLWSGPLHSIHACRSRMAKNPLRCYIAAHTFIFMAIDTRLSNFYPLSIIIPTTYSPNIILATDTSANVNYTAVINTTKNSQYGTTRRIQRGSYPTSPSICQGLHPPCQEMHQARS